MVYLHAKYEKPILNDKKVTARTRFVTSARTSLTSRSKLKVKCHQQWYATHHLDVVYLHPKYEKPVLKDKKVTARTRFVTDGRTDGQTDHYRASATLWRGPNKGYHFIPWPKLRIYNEGRLIAKLNDKRDDFNSSFICSIIQAPPAYEIYISLSWSDISQLVAPIMISSIAGCC